MSPKGESVTCSYRPPTTGFADCTAQRAASRTRRRALPVIVGLLLLLIPACSASSPPGSPGSPVAAEPSATLAMSTPLQSSPTATFAPDASWPPGAGWETPHFSVSIQTPLGSLPSGTYMVVYDQESSSGSIDAYAYVAWADRAVGPLLQVVPESSDWWQWRADVIPGTQRLAAEVLRPREGTFLADIGLENAWQVTFCPSDDCGSWSTEFAGPRYVAFFRSGSWFFVSPDDPSFVFEGVLPSNVAELVGPAPELEWVDEQTVRLHPVARTVVDKGQAFAYCTASIPEWEFTCVQLPWPAFSTSPDGGWVEVRRYFGESPPWIGLVRADCLGEASLGCDPTWIPEPEGLEGFEHPAMAASAWRPDSGAILFRTGDCEFGPAYLWTYDIATSTSALLAKLEGDSCYDGLAGWSPDGSALLLNSTATDKAPAIISLADGHLERLPVVGVVVGQVVVP